MTTIPERQNTTEEGQVALPPTAAEMGREQTVREQLAAALAWALPRVNLRYASPGVLVSYRDAIAALERHRAEPEETCTAACDQPTEAHPTSDCPCWQAGHEEGYSEGTEAQRERVGGGTA